jgi:predicted metal-dependent hydrolase
MPRNNNPKGRILNEFSYCWSIFSVRHPAVSYPSVDVKKLAPHIAGRTSSSGEITLNVSLGAMSTDGIRHVIFHELCHLIHFNHSREFYDALDELDPLHRKRNGAYLKKRLQNLENLVENEKHSNLRGDCHSNC